MYSLRSSARIRARRALRVCAVGMLLVACTPVPGAGAQPGAAEEPGAGERFSQQERSSRYQRARDHFLSGMAHYEARRYREAIREFRLSIAQVPNADLWFNIGRAHEQLGDRAEAIEHYQLYLRDRVDPPDAAEVGRRIARLRGQDRLPVPDDRTDEPAEGSLALSAAQSGALVLLDGEALGTGPLERVLPLEPGAYRLEASRPGFIPFRAEVDVYPRTVTVARVRLQPLTHRQAHTPSRPFTWVTSAASAGAFLASGALGLGALDRRDAGEPGQARDLARGADLALGAGLVLAIGATLLYFIEAEASAVLVQTDAPAEHAGR